MRIYLLPFSLYTFAILFVRCAAVPMPAMVVPDQGNSVEATVYAGNNGFGINALYATKRLTLFNAAIQRSPILTDSRAYEFGFGQVFTDAIHKTSMMMLITGGYGKYNAQPYVLGGSGQIYEVNSQALRLSFYGNWQFAGRKSGVIGRFSIYDGQSGQKRINGQAVAQHDFTSVGCEFFLYLTPGKRRHFLLGAGLGLSTGNREATGREEILKDFNPSPVNLFLGYRLAKNPKPLPLPLAQ